MLILKKGIKFLYYIVLFFICLEIALLILGYRKYTNTTYSIKSSPEYCIIPHKNLGFALKPGQFNITINKGLNYKVSHTSDSLRYTGVSYKYNPKVYFFGCSYTYGMGVNDNENFVYLFQEKHPNLNVKNFGIPGYGTIQCLLQLKSLITKQDIPNTIVVNYANFHDIRNSLTPQYRLNLKMGYELANDSLKKLMLTSNVPYIKKNKKTFIIDYCKWENLYKNWQLRETLASVNYLQTLLDKQTEKNIPTQQITLFIFDEIKKLCDKHNIKLVVTGITQNNDTKKFLNNLKIHQIKSIDISVNLSDNKYNNTPYDNHPNKLAHLEFAKALNVYFDTSNISL